MKAGVDGTVLAESAETVVVEGNHYFPPEAIRWEYLAASPTTSRCIWKGKASYFHVLVDGRQLPDAAWTYHRPWLPARRLKDHVAFWRGVEVE